MTFLGSRKCKPKDKGISGTPLDDIEANTSAQDIMGKTKPQCAKRVVLVMAIVHAVPFIAFVVEAVLSGLVFCLVTGYPYWLWFTFDTTQKPSNALPPLIGNTTRQ